MKKTKFFFFIPCSFLLMSQYFELGIQQSEHSVIPNFPRVPPTSNIESRLIVYQCAILLNYYIINK